MADDKKNRLLAAYGHLKGHGVVHTQNDVARIMKANKTNVSYAFGGNEKYLTDKFLRRFNGSFGGIFQIDWLLTGKGEMLKDGPVISHAEAVVMNDTALTGKLIPLFDADAAAGTAYVMNMEAAKHATMINIGGFLGESEAAIRIYGNSMTPHYPPGCIVGTKQWNERFIEPGKVYVIETRENRFIKRLRYNSGKTAYRCLSDNTMKHEKGEATGEYCYPEFEIPIEDVIRLHRVVGVIKRNML